MSKKKILIFDFDGVILDSVNIKTLAFQEIFKEHSKIIVKKITHHHEVNGGMSRSNKIKYYYKYFIKKRLTKKNEEKIIKKFKLIIFKKILKCKYIVGSYLFIKKNKNYDCYISSGTPQNELREICKIRGISKYFKKIYGSPQKKEDHIKQIFKKHKQNKRDFIFLGDSITDKDAAKKCNIPFIQVGNFISKSRKAKIIIPNLKKLDDILKKLDD
tara:strand:+ start:5861 stop:6505 length:645 start_codon:yes stop_codon:yes gene_type:complete